MYEKTGQLVQCMWEMILSVALLFIENYQSPNAFYLSPNFVALKNGTLFFGETGWQIWWLLVSYQALAHGQLAVVIIHHSID